MTIGVNVPEQATESVPVEPRLFSPIPILIKMCIRDRKACNAAGIWGEENVMEIVIAPPFWKTTWAYLLYALLIAVAGYFSFHIIRNFNALRNRIAVENQLTEYKLEFFTNISHEFRTPLTLIQGALERIVNMGNHSRDIDVYKRQLPAL